MRIPKKALIAGGILLVLALPFIAKRGAGDAVEVQVAVVSPQAIRPTILASGNLAFRTEVNLTSEVLAKVAEVLVKEGEQVKQGQRIANAGSTGWSTGPHVHLEIRINGKPEDPMKHLK